MTTTTTRTCETCGTPLPPKKGRGRPQRYCRDACRTKAARRKAKDAEADEHAATVAKVRAELLTLLDNVNPLPDEPALSPGGYEWHRFALPLLSIRDARLYRRLWRTAATPSERRLADMGTFVPLDPARLREAALRVAEAIADPTPFQMSTPPALRMDPNLIPGEGARPPMAFLGQREADGFPVDGAPMDTPVSYGYALGYYADEHHLYEAMTYEEWLAAGRPARRPGEPKIRLAKDGDHDGE